jgi:hypothetical protein
MVAGGMTPLSFTRAMPRGARAIDLPPSNRSSLNSKKSINPNFQVLTHPQSKHLRRIAAVYAHLAENLALTNSSA